ncbi:MAG: hypothetical protein WCJ64_04600 [Rhodospirillaceae bacterium]
MPDDDTDDAPATDTAESRALRRTNLHQRFAKLGAECPPSSQSGAVDCGHAPFNLDELADESLGGWGACKAMPPEWENAAARNLSPLMREADACLSPKRADAATAFQIIDAQNTCIDYQKATQAEIDVLRYGILPQNLEALNGSLNQIKGLSSLVDQNFAASALKEPPWSAVRADIGPDKHFIISAAREASHWTDGISGATAGQRMAIEQGRDPAASLLVFATPKDAVAEICRPIDRVSQQAEAILRASAVSAVQHPYRDPTADPAFWQSLNGSDHESALRFMAQGGQAAWLGSESAERDAARINEWLRTDGARADISQTAGLSAFESRNALERLFDQYGLNSGANDSLWQPDTPVWIPPPPRRAEHASQPKRENTDAQLEDKKSKIVTLICAFKATGDRKYSLEAIEIASKCGHNLLGLTLRKLGFYDDELQNSWSTGSTKPFGIEPERVSKTSGAMVPPGPKRQPSETEVCAIIDKLYPVEMPGVNIARPAIRGAIRNGGYLPFPATEIDRVINLPRYKAKRDGRGRKPQHF